MELISVIGILVGLAVMILLAWRNVSVYIFAIASSVVVILFSRLPVLDTLSNVYMEGFVYFAKNYFLLFLFSSIFAKIMGDSGATKVIAIKIAALTGRAKSQTNKAFIAVMSISLITIVFTLGGINLFVVAFLMIHITKDVFKELNIPWHLSALTGFAGSTFTMTMVPGTPAIQNLIPMAYLGTKATAAPVLGILCTIFCLILEVIYIKYAIHRSEKRNEGFFPTGAVIDARDYKMDMTLPKYSLLYCLIPSINMLVMMNVMGWSPVASMFFASLAGYFMFRKNLKDISKSLTEGALNALGVITAVCAVVGFGSVVAATPGYAYVLAALDSIPGTPLVSMGIAVNIAAGFTGSASGGLGIALNSLAGKYLNMGIKPELIHRISCIASGGLDSLPHSGTVISTLQLGGLTHRQAYLHSFWQSTVIPLIVMFLGIFLASLGIV